MEKGLLMVGVIHDASSLLYSCMCLSSFLLCLSTDIFILKLFKSSDFTINLINYIIRKIWHTF